MASDPISAADFFECARCGECCRGFGGTYVDAQDIAAIAGHLKLSVQRVRQSYCTGSGARPVLAQRADGFCIFWEKVCTIHPVKPLMCRRWPFIPTLLVAPENWRIMADSCPGIRRDADPRALLRFTRSLLRRTQPRAPLPERKDLK